MTKLERRLYDSFDSEEWWKLYYESDQDEEKATREASARIAASIVLEYAEKSYRVGRAEAGTPRTFEQFKQEIL